MKLDEFTDLLDRRGGDSDNWPAPEREGAAALLRESSAARELLRRQQMLESLLERDAAPEFAGLEAKVLGQALPRRAGTGLEGVIAWLTPGSSPGGWWRPALAACLPLVCGIALSGFFGFGLDAEDPGYAYWDQELYLLSLYEYAETATEAANE